LLQFTAYATPSAFSSSFTAARRLRDERVYWFWFTSTVWPIWPMQSGLDQVQATEVVNNARVSSNVATVAWNTGTNQAPVVVKCTSKTTIAQQAW